MSTRSTKHRITLAKDIILTGVGISGIAYQTLTGKVDYALLGVFVAMTGMPGLTSTLLLVRSNTDSQSQLPASPDSPMDVGS